MGFGTPVWTHFMPKRTTERAKQGWRAEPCWRFLLDADLRDEPKDFGFRDVVERAHIFFLEPLAQVLRGDKARFPVGQVAPGLLAEFHKRGVRQADDMGLAIDKKLGVNGVRMPRGNAVPHVRKAALIRLRGQFGSHFEGADELAHRAGIGKYWAYCHARSLADCLFKSLP